MGKKKPTYFFLFFLTFDIYLLDEVQNRTDQSR